MRFGRQAGLQERSGGTRWALHWVKFDSGWSAAAYGTTDITMLLLAFHQSRTRDARNPDLFYHLVAPAGRKIAKHLFELNM